MKRSTRHSTRRTAGRAFTLVELMVVVVILGVAALLAVPMLGSTDSTRLSAAARRVLSDLTYAQNLAITTGRPHLIALDGVGTHRQAVRLLAEPPGGGTPVAVDHPIDPGPYVVRFGDGATAGMGGVTLAAPDAYGGPALLGFDELGGPIVYQVSTGQTADLSAAVRIELRAGNALSVGASGGPKLTIRLEPVTGEMSVE